MTSSESEMRAKVQKFQHAGAVSSVAWHPAGTHVATGSRDHCARVFDVASGREILRSQMRLQSCATECIV